MNEELAREPPGSINLGKSIGQMIVRPRLTMPVGAVVKIAGQS